MANLAVSYYATAAASGTTTTETAITLTKSIGGNYTISGGSFLIPKGTTFVIQNLVVGTRGNVTGTTQSTVFNLRVSGPGGAVTTTSVPVILKATSVTPATTLAYDRLQPISDASGLVITGGVGIEWGITAAATFVTNAPTWDVYIQGYEMPTPTS